MSRAANPPLNTDRLVYPISRPVDTVYHIIPSSYSKTFQFLGEHRLRKINHHVEWPFLAEEREETDREKERETDSGERGEVQQINNRYIAPTQNTSIQHTYNTHHRACEYSTCDAFSAFFFLFLCFFRLFGWFPVDRTSHR